MASLDSNMIAAGAAILGSAVGGLATFLTTLLNQRYLARKDMQARDLAHRENLYSQLVEEVSKLYFNSFSQTKVEPSALVAMFSVIGRIRLISSEKVLQEAENIADEVVGAYYRPPIEIEELHKLGKERRLDPLRNFTMACREERESILRHV